MKIIDAIVCDDIRKEIDNKLTLVGVYGENIVFTPDKPITTNTEVKIPKQLGFLIKIAFDTQEELELTKFQGNIYLKSDTDKKPLRCAKIEGVIKGDLQKSMALDFVLTINLLKSGELYLVFKAFKGEKLIAEESHHLVEVEIKTSPH